MPMKLDGSCQCGVVTFTLSSSTPVPFMFCGCSICRKIGTYGFSCNLGGISSTHEIHTGADKIKIHHAVKNRGKANQERCKSERHFCGECGSMLWLFDASYPELVHPFASAIDTELPVPPAAETVALLNADRPGWVRWPEGVGKVFEGYPEESLEAWHKRTGMWVE